MNNDFWDGSKVLHRYCKSCGKETNWYLEVDGSYYCENINAHPLPIYEKYEKSEQEK